MSTLIFVVVAYFIVVTALTIKWMVEAPVLPDNFDE
jgi:hypothetical protein